MNKEEEGFYEKYQFLKKEYDDIKEKYTYLQMIHDTMCTVSKDNREKVEHLQQLNTALMIRTQRVEDENKALREEHMDDKKALMKMRLELATAMREISKLTLDVVCAKKE